ncbi:hypothetical protein BU16DRAFT_538429 [Lophium mytilinum]|uniref:Uncharacterized protein n=1 Tax=Lophium mytilinum TaxID=390894 RepID=A0A6A6QTS3_9PEZI|nr:hypothetical protein BU16DRAFT_538429 [Lophium mytilinum]
MGSKVVLIYGAAATIEFTLTTSAAMCTTSISSLETAPSGAGRVTDRDYTCGFPELNAKVWHHYKILVSNLSPSSVAMARMIGRIAIWAQCFAQNGLVFRVRARSLENGAVVTSPVSFPPLISSPNPHTSKYIEQPPTTTNKTSPLSSICAKPPTKSVPAAAALIPFIPPAPNFAGLTRGWTSSAMEIQTVRDALISIVPRRRWRRVSSARRKSAWEGVE